MAVPKLVVNVFYSHLDNQVYSKFPFRIKTAMVDPYMGNTIKTFFSPFQKQASWEGAEKVVRGKFWTGEAFSDCWGR
jgi:hypothetical protein